MADIETVVKALECCTTTDEQGFPRCEECPYADPDGTCPDLDGMHRDALELLKEREPVPAKVREFHHLLFWCCGSCDTPITDGDKFCRMCGKRVKWDDD